MATILGLLPHARRRHLSLWRRLQVLWHWLVVVVNCDALLAELLDLLPHCR
jgi:hypothetical protein